MKPLKLAEIKNIADYELEREQWRPAIMALKDRRRIEAGEHIIFLFENRDTVRYQIQEMLRIERIAKTEDVQHELDTYNELIPSDGELSATMLIAYPSANERDVKLRELLGLENHVWLQVCGAERTPARFDTRQISTDRISSVQYAKFPLTDQQIRCWRDGAVLLIDHPHYKCSRALTSAELEELASDLSK
ncbi:MAG: DUF3501 family protein [Acidobacteria bacterium]|nr:DUF3501 family protein [Acidobacteriota bacterium]